MKNKILLIVLFTLMFSVFVSCAGDKVIRPNTPTNTAWLTKIAINNNDYERFNSFFSEDRKNAISEDMLSEFNKIGTPGASYIHYELVGFTNGEMLLMRLTAEKVDGAYKVENVIIVPEEMKKLFQEDAKAK